MPYLYTRKITLYLSLIHICGDPHENVRSFHHIRQAAFFTGGIGDGCHLGFDGIQSFAALIDGALPVAKDNVFQPHRHQKFGAGDTGSTCAIDHHRDLGKLLANQF